MRQTGTRPVRSGIIGRQVPVRPFFTEGDQRAVDESWIYLAQYFIADFELFDFPETQVSDKHVRLLHKAVHYLLPLFAGKVERHAFLVAVVGFPVVVEIARGAGVPAMARLQNTPRIAGFWIFDVQHIRAKIAQVPGADGHGRHL